MTETGWNPTNRWFVAAIAFNSVGIASGFVADQLGGPTWLTAARGVLLLAAIACFVVFSVKWWRRRAGQPVGTEDSSP